MGKFKKEHGETRIGKFLKNVSSVAPGILDMAGNITGIDVLNKLSSAIKGTTSMSEIDKALAIELLELDKLEMAEATKRHTADMASDSWLSKNIRPLALIGLTIALILFITLDSQFKTFHVGDEWITLLKSLLIPIYLFYFGGREIQKGIINYRKKHS